MINSQTHSKIQNALQSYENYNKYLKNADMELAALSCINKAKTMREIDTRVLFIGSQNCGKSTVINAVIGETVVQTGISKGTATINLIKSGDPSDAVKVYYNDETEPECISKEAFDAKYNRDMEQTERIIRGDITVEQYKNIKYAEISCEPNSLPVGLQLIDTPCLEDKNSTRRIEQQFLSNADVIVFVLDGTAPFRKAEYEFIQTHFSKKHITNVFFLVNKADTILANNIMNIAEKCVRDKLHDVFLDENCNVDEKLYNSRVFFVDALTSLCARTGFKYVCKGAQWVQLPVDSIEDQFTGILEFEAALTEYLNSEVFLAGKLEAILKNMAHTYSVVEKRYIEYSSLLQKTPKEVHKYIVDALRSIDQKLDFIYITEHEVSDIGHKIAYEIWDSWYDFIGNELPKRWGNQNAAVLDYMQHQQVFANVAGIPLMPPVRRSLIEKVNLFFIDSFDIWNASVKQMISAKVDQIGIRIEKTSFTLNSELEQIIDDAMIMINKYWEEHPALFGFHLQGCGNNLLHDIQDALHHMHSFKYIDLIQAPIRNETKNWSIKHRMYLQEEEKYYNNLYGEYGTRHLQETICQQNRMLEELFVYFEYVYWECYGNKPTIHDLKKLI